MRSDIRDLFTLPANSDDLGGVNSTHPKHYHRVQYDIYSFLIPFSSAGVLVATDSGEFGFQDDWEIHRGHIEHFCARQRH